jgi:hypothetical protein
MTYQLKEWSKNQIRKTILLRYGDNVIEKEDGGYYIIKIEYCMETREDIFKIKDQNKWYKLNLMTAIRLGKNSEYIFEKPWQSEGRELIMNRKNEEIARLKAELRETRHRLDKAGDRLTCILCRDAERNTSIIPWDPTKIPSSPTTARHNSKYFMNRFRTFLPADQIGSDDFSSTVRLFYTRKMKLPDG